MFFVILALAAAVLGACALATGEPKKTPPSKVRDWDSYEDRYEEANRKANELIASLEDKHEAHGVSEREIKDITGALDVLPEEFTLVGLKVVNSYSHTGMSQNYWLRIDETKVFDIRRSVMMTNSPNPELTVYDQELYAAIVPKLLELAKRENEAYEALKKEKRDEILRKLGGAK